MSPRLLNMLYQWELVMTPVQPLYWQFRIQTPKTLQQKRDEAVQWMGNRWVGHPDNRVRRAV